MRKIYFLLIGICFGLFSQAQVANYSFSSSSGTYTSLSSPINVFTGSWDDNSAVSVPIGFSFTFNGAVYTSVFVHPNGYISFGSSTSGYNPISGTSSVNGIVSAWGRDLQAQATTPPGSVDYQTTGGVFVVQWSNARRYNASANSERFDMQIRLTQTTNIVQIVYGTWSAAAGASSSSNGEVGLRGASNADFKNLSVVSGESWANPTAGSQNTATCFYNESNTATRPAIGQTYTFTPPPACTAPTAHPVSLALVPSSTSISGSFPAAAGSPTGYLIVRTTTPTPPTNPVDGTTYTSGTNALNGFIVQQSASTTFLSTGLQPSTTYYYFIFPYNSAGCLGGPLYRTPSPNYPGATTTACTPLAAGTYSVGPTGTYSSITTAIAALASGFSGNVVFELQPAYVSTVETFPITLSPGGVCSGSGTVTIRPSAGATGLTINSSNTTATFDINGGTNLIIDGRPGGVGTTGDLVIQNTSTTGSAIRFINGASTNRIQYAAIRGVNTSMTGGVVLFSTASTTAGNNGNVLDNCQIGDGATTPVNAIYSSGTSTLSNQNNTVSNSLIFNYFSATLASAGIKLETGSTGWTISGNRFYQTAARTQTTSGQHSAIWVNNTSGNNFQVLNNIIGYSSPSGTGSYSLVGAATTQFAPISLAVGTTIVSSIQGNTIAGIAISGSLAGATSLSPLRCIHVSSGWANVGNINGNLIGSLSSTGSISYASSSTSNSEIYGVYNASTSSTIISNNTIGGIIGSNSSTGAVLIYGVRAGASSTAASVLENNIVGGAVTNSIQSTTTATASLVQGVLISSSSATIRNNTIRNLSAAGGTGTTSAASLAGIVFTSTTSGVNHVVSGNQIFNLNNSNTTAATVVTGIQYTSSTGRNLIERNLIHSLNSASNSATAEVNGIRIAGGTATYQNNMIALGASTSNAILVTGINDQLSTTSNTFFHNSVYIGGTATAGTANSFAFNSIGTTNTRVLRNNIFVNQRVNSSATGKNYAVQIGGTAANPAGLSIGNNIYFVSGTGTVFGRYNSFDVTSLAAWRTAVGQDDLSIEANPQFLNPTAASPDLHLHPTNTTPAEGNGAVVAVTDDFDGQTRSSLTPVDIGADAGNFQGIPVFSFTPPSNSSCITGISLSVVITDASGINSTAGTNPRVYYKKSSNANALGSTNDNTTNGWKFVETSSTSSPFSFALDLSLINGGVAAGDVIQYFVVAQDLASTPVVGISDGSFAAVPASVSLTSAAFPIAGTIRSYNLTSGTAALSGTITIGASGTYSSLTGTSGLFAAINTNGISGNLTVLLQDASITETGATALNPISYGCSGPSTVTIRPATGVTSTLSGSLANGSLIRIFSSNVTIDGSNSGGATRNLSITNTSTTNPGVLWIGSTGSIPVRNVSLRNTIVTNGSNANAGIVVGDGVTNGNPGYFNNINIHNNDIRRSAWGLFFRAVISSGNGSGTVISNNLMNTVGSDAIRLIGIDVGGVDGLTISNNTIGNINNTIDNLLVRGINISSGVDNAVISQNNISNITGTNAGGNATVSGIYLTPGNFATSILVSGNTISNLAGTGTFTAFSGIASFGPNTSLRNNTITGMTQNGAVGFWGIVAASPRNCDISGNIVGNLSTTTIGTANGINLQGGIESVNVFNNNVYNISNTNNGGYTAYGIALQASAYNGTNYGARVYNNQVSGVFGFGGSAGTVNWNGYGIGVTSGSGYQIHHNTVNLNKDQLATGGVPAAFFVSSGVVVPGAISLQNNIFSNNQTIATGASTRYAIYVNTSNQVFSTINNNNYYSAGTNLGYIGSDRATLTDIIAGFGGNQNSVTANSTFVSATDLHLASASGQNWTVNNAGAPISFVTSDIDGETRSTTTPDIGADEFNASSFVVTNPAAVCAPNTVNITAAAVTAGTTSGTTFTYWTDAAGTITLTNAAAVATSGTYYIKATFGTADNYWIKPVVVVVNPLPTPSITGAAVLCEASTGNVYSVANVAGNTYNWTVTGGTITAGQGTNSITVTWGAAGTATVTVTETITATGCVQTATLSITLNPNPTPVITGLAAVCTTNEGYVYSVPSVAGNTYAWSVGGGTITAGAGTNAITVTWGAVGAGSVTVTQTVTATGCATTVSRATNIQTLPTATATVVEPVTCASEDGQINLTLGGAAGPYTFAWTGTGNGLSATTQNQPVVSTGFYNVTVTAANGCTVTVPNIVVSGPGGCFICPTIGTITSTATIICQDGANTITAGGLADLGITYGIRFKYSATPLANPYLSTAGTVMGTVSNANLTVVGGTTTSTSASINYNFPTAGTMYVYAILSPASPDPACRPFLMIPVEVAPTPVLTRPADQVRCTGSATAAVNFLAAPATTTTFAWTNNRTSIGLAASGTGNIASFTATNFTNAPVTALITVTPTNTQTLGASTVVCPGPAQTYSYTINPIPTVNTVTNQSVCAGTTVSLPFSGFVTGTVYEWTNSNTAIGLAATGTGTLSYTATNNTSSPITATIIVTPKFTSAGGTCTGNPISFEITVNPTPVVDAIPAQVLCSGSATTAISLTSATTGTAFSWTNSATSVGLAGTGTGTSIASFTAVNTGAAPVNAIISITPSYTGAGFTCTGSVGTTTITVNPIPATTGIADRVICNGAATTFTLTGPVTAAVYNWTNSNTGIGLAGTGSGTIAFTASNTTGAPITSTIEVTPSITNAGLACVGGTSSFTVTVNPSGQVNAIDNQVLCNGSATSAVTFSTVNNGLISTGGSQVASSGTISVAVPDASAVGATHTIPVTLPTGAVITNMRVTMNLTHTWISDMIINLRAPNGQVLNLFNGHGGSGDNLVNTIISSTGTASLASGTAPFTGTFAATAAIGVGPTGNASTAANFAALYSTANGNWILSMRDLELGDLGTLTGWSIAFDYVVQGQFGTNMNWTNSLSSIGLAATGTGNIPSFTAANTTADPVVSTVTVTPSYFNAGTSCAGAPVTFTYTVNPTPTVNTVANQVFCAGTPSTVNFSGATTGTVFNWTSSNASIGLATSGSGNLSFTPTNTSNVPIVSTITVTPVFTNGGVTCTGTPRTFTITVNPVGQVNTVLNQVLCNGAATTAVNFATVNGGGTVQVGTPVTVNSGAITVAIPDASAVGTTHTLPVTLPAGATITGVSVSFNMTHTWVGDVVVNLRAPNGQILNLVNRRGGSGDNFVNTTISSASTTSLATGTAPFTGTFAADGALNLGPTTFVSSATNFAALYSVANGDWTLGMRDYAAGDNGTLTGWSITFNYTTVAGAVTTYNWTNTTPSIGLAASGVGNIASFAAANTSTVPVTATVSVTPTYTNAGVGCAGPASSFTYTVNPTPTVNAVSNQAVCRGSNVAAISFGGTVSGTVYNWTNTNTAIGLAASGTGDIASFVGANTTSAPISGTITVTPVFTNAGITCTGTPRTFTITVNPIPTVNSVASFPVCHNSVAAVTFSGATTGTVYNWTNTNTTIGLPASGTGNLNFTALNTTSAPTVATITVTPVFTNGGTACTGTPISFTITVNPLPVVSAGTLPARICISDTLVSLNGTPVGGSWSGIGTSGMNFVPTATAVGTWPITYTFSDINGCTNRATIAATVLSCDERDRDLDNSAVLLYPNPNSGQFNLRINSTRFNALGMRVFNTAGQLVSTKQWSGLVYARVVPVNLTNLPAGIYMVRLYYGDGMDRGADKTYQIIIAR